MWVIHCFNVNNNLTTLEILLIWEVMFKPVKIRSYAPVLNLVISELNGYPVGVKYHYIWKDYQKNQSKCSDKIKETMINYL